MSKIGGRWYSAADLRSDGMAEMQPDDDTVAREISAAMVAYLRAEPKKAYKRKR